MEKKTAGSVADVWCALKFFMSMIIKHQKGALIRTILVIVAECLRLLACMRDKLHKSSFKINVSRCVLGQS